MMITIGMTMIDKMPAAHQSKKQGGEVDGEHECYSAESNRLFCIEAA